MKTYYKKRAPVYDRVYSYPERQEDLRFLQNYIPRQFAGADVLEIAAGTGYWTQYIIREANSLLAIDILEEPLVQIKARALARPVETKVIDAYRLQEAGTHFTGAFAGLWLSHIPKERLNEFLTGLHAHLHSRSTVLFIDNTMAQCSRLPISDTDKNGNTYQDRILDDGSVHRVLKNFPTEMELMNATAKLGHEHHYIQREHFWLFQYVSN